MSIAVIPASTDPVPLGAVTIFRLISAFEQTVSGFGAWRRARSTERALRRLSDVQLEDIGLVRGQIPALAEGLARA